MADYPFENLLPGISCACASHSLVLSDDILELPSNTVEGASDFQVLTFIISITLTRLNQNLISVRQCVSSCLPKLGNQQARFLGSTSANLKPAEILIRLLFVPTLVHARPVHLLPQMCKLLVPRLLILRRLPNYLPIHWIKSHQHSWLVKEHLIHLFQSPPRCLYAEEVSERNARCTDNSPDPEIVSTDRIQPDRRHHHHHKVRGPVREDAYGCRLIAHAQRLNLGGVRPGDREDAECETVQVEEHKRYSGRGVGVALPEQASCDDGHADCAAGRREHSCPTAADTVNVEVRRPREYGVLGESDAGEN